MHTPQNGTESIRTAKNTVEEFAVDLFPDLGAFSLRYRAGGPQFHSPGLEHRIPPIIARSEIGHTEDDGMKAKTTYCRHQALHV